MSDGAHPQPDLLLRRPALRMAAVTLWAGFLGAVPMLLMFLFAVPLAWPELLTLGALSQIFFLCWLLASVPAFVAALLSARSERQDAHGR